MMHNLLVKHKIILQLLIQMVNFINQNLLLLILFNKGEIYIMDISSRL